MNLNALKQYMDFYEQQGMGPQNTGSGGFQPTIFDRKGMAADWAMKMMQQPDSGNRPDFFASQPERNTPAYVQPANFGAQSAQPQPAYGSGTQYLGGRPDPTSISQWRPPTIPGDQRFTQESLDPMLRWRPSQPSGLQNFLSRLLNQGGGNGR